MYNPFEGTMPPVENSKYFIGRQEIYEKLDEKICNQQNIVIQGVQGSGKTSLLRTYFNKDYKIKMAADRNAIVVLESYPVYLTCNGVFDFFSERIIHALRVLEYCGQEEKLKKIKKQIKIIRQEYLNSDARLRSIVELLYMDYGYKVLVVLDDFEIFTSSKEITVSHHNLLRSLMDRGLQFIVATNFDLTRDSLNGEIEGGSFLLQKFLGNEILMKGFDEKETEEYINAYLTGVDYKFDNYEIRTIYIISGGIPVLVRMTAKAALDIKQVIHRNLRSEDFDAIVPRVVADARNILESWYKYLTKRQYNAIQYLLEKPRYSNDGVTMKKFSDRGVFKAYVEFNANGHPYELIDTYDFNSIILEEFSKDSETLIALVERNEPLIQIKMEEYNRILQIIKDKDSKWREVYTEAIYNSGELEKQLRLIADTCDLQKNELDIIKDLILDLSCGKRGKTGIIEKIGEGLMALSTGVTLVTADYGQIERLFVILSGILKNIIK